MPYVVKMPKPAPTRMNNLKSYKKISSLNGIPIHHKKSDDSETFVAHDEGRGHMTVHLKTNDDGHKYVSMIKKTPKFSAFKAHELYHHIITHHNQPISSDTWQSSGAKDTWKNLIDKKDIEVKTNKGRSVTPENFDDHYTEKNNNTYFIAKHKT